MIELFKEALKQYEKRYPCAFVTIVSTAGSVPQIVGAKMLVVDRGERHLTFGTIGGGNLEHTAVEEALSVLRSDGSPRFMQKDLGDDLGMACGGSAHYFIEPVTTPPTLYLCGAGHIGKALYEVCRGMAFRTVLIDPMTEYANRERFPEVVEIVHSFDEVELEEQVTLTERDFVVIVSRDHPTDFRLVRFFLPKEWRYLGVIASRTKAELLRRELVQEGYAGDRIERIVSPIGLPIGGSSPREIAVSIAAQLIQVMYTTNSM
jgi:xanthine dehydrogenase accessory factor